MEKIVEVSWIDAGLETIKLGAGEVEQLTPMPRVNVGYLIMKNKEKVILCFGTIEDREHHNQVWDVTMVIPRGCVTDIRELK